MENKTQIGDAPAAIDDSQKPPIEKYSLPKGTCFFGHKWTAWKAGEREGIFRNGTKFKEGCQTRYCLRCNKRQTEEI